MVKKILLAITGASGSIYSYEFCKILREKGIEVHLIFSETGYQVSLYELGQGAVSGLKDMAQKVYDVNSFWEGPASGSNALDAMVIMPCTMGTLGAIANGISQNLIHRAADCFLKEGRPLLLAVRETPLNEIHLENMLKLKRVGAIIFPAMPSFYTRPKDLSEMAHFFSGRVARYLGIEVEDLPSWKG